MTVIAIEPEFRAVLEIVLRQPHLPPTYMALRLEQHYDDVLLRLQAATAVGWLTEKVACCGQQSRFAISDEGRSVLDALHTSD